MWDWTRRANSIYALAADTDDKFKDQGDALIEDVNAFTRAGGSDVNFHWVSEWDRNLETFMTSTISGWVAFRSNIQPFFSWIDDRRFTFQRSLDGRTKTPFGASDEENLDLSDDQNRQHEPRPEPNSVSVLTTPVLLMSAV